MQLDQLLKTGRYRHDRHAHLLAESTEAVSAAPYSEFDDDLWQRNQELYERLWGPVPWLHPADFDDRLAEWLESDVADKCIRGRTLKSLDVDCDSLTRRWIYNQSDVEAAKVGCRVDESRIKKVLDFIVGKLILYEGEYAGRRFRPMAWQIELFGRAFGWVVYSPDWGREVRRFRKCIVFIPKKTGKSPTGAAVGTYLTIGDGEQGAKTFSAAKDGKQAGIVHMHARNFIKKHDFAHGKANRLGCTVNKSSGEIYHEATESYYRILSADNIDGQEGLNGNAIIDETHVVDERLAKVLEYMGASRPEPMQFEISTAGNDLMAYGHSQFDYGRLVESGDVIDQQVLYMGFGIFSDNADEESEDTHQRANPSWFVTIKPSEFSQSMTRAKNRGKSAYDTFCMYRLNKWLSGASPWLEIAEWKACSCPWELEDKQGAQAVVGMDISRTRDMSAAVLSINDGVNVWIKPYLWITERYVEQWRDRMPQWKTWEDEGAVTVVPGDLIDYQAIYDRMTEIASVVDVRSIVFDPTYAGPILQWAPSSAVGGAELVQFCQSSNLYEGKIDEFEAGVKNGLIKHDGNPCLTWQAGHTQTKENPRGQRILVKPVSKDDPRKIDGMVGAVMSYSVAMLEMKCWSGSEMGL